MIHDASHIPKDPEEALQIRQIDLGYRGRILSDIYSDFTTRFAIEHPRLYEIVRSLINLAS